MANERLERFVALMRSIFELDKSDLDFGIYRIINLRKAKIEEFLTVGLPKKVQETLAPFAKDDAKDVKAQLAEIEASARQFGVADIATLPEGNPMRQKYQDLQRQLTSGTDMAGLETDVYSALFSFFNRYYDEGDFISKRRYKEGVYAIPYEGEEVKLYWANQDQYYIKTSENFKDYTFIAEGVTVHFRLVDATTEQNNNKESDDSKRTFMLYTEDEEHPDIHTFDYDPEKRELIIRFVFDIPEDKRRKYKEENYATIKQKIVSDYEALMPILLTNISTDPKKPRTLMMKHLDAYVAKNTFDYFIHKDLGGFLRRELDFYIKSEVMHLDDLDTDDEQRVNTYLAKVKAIKRVGHVIIDFLAQLEDFQKKLWLKKKFVVETNWCITLDHIDEDFWPEIIANKAQIQEWIDMYAINEAEGWMNPPSMDFLRQNQNLIVDTKHFSQVFRDKLVANIDDLEGKIGGLLVWSENYQALRLLQKRYSNAINCIHIDPPYNTATSGFLYKNNYQHSSWASMMADRISAAYELLEDNRGIFFCHIDENEYELLFKIFDQFERPSAGTIIWDKLNPMLGRKGVATQHEYVIFRTNDDESIPAKNENVNRMREYAEEAIRRSAGIVDDAARKLYAQMVSQDDTLSGGEKAYRLLDDSGRIYRLVAMGAPEKRKDPKYYIPLIHPITKKPCPVPPTGWSRKPETLASLMESGDIIFGKDETTQPQKKVLLPNKATKQISSVLADGKSGKAVLDKLGLEFPYAHPASMYESLVSANDSQFILDYFAGSGTTGHAIVNLNRQDTGNRRYCLIEMGEHFRKVMKPRMKKVIYSEDWKNGKPLTRDKGLSHIMKYIRLEGYEDALSNIELDTQRGDLLSGLFGDEYLIHYMMDFEASNSLLDVDSFKNPFEYRMKITENNEAKLRPVDVVETFNYLIGLSVVHQGTVDYFHTQPDPQGAYEGAVRLTKDNGGEYGFQQIEGTLPDGRKALVIWRTVTGDLIKSNAALDAYFSKHRINPQDREYDVIYVNGDSNLENLRMADEQWKVVMTELEFKSKMFEEE